MTGEPTWAVTSSARLFVGFEIAVSIVILATVLRFLLRQMLLIDGVALDADANDAGNTRISNTASGVEVLVYATDEEAMIAQHTHAVLSRELATMHA
jgi:hypothetical protein